MSVHVVSDLPTGKKFRLSSINGDRALTRRLKALGISPGNEFEIIEHQRNGVVLARDGNRVALGKSIAIKLQAEDIY
jgi:ferrous iron transport protein A